MQKPAKRKIVKLLLWLTLLYIAGGIAIYFLQDRFILQPKKLTADYQYSFQLPFREINLPVNNDRNINIIQFTVPDSIRKGVVLYYHGNKQNVEHYASFASNFTNNHYEVWMMDYPGFGKSTGVCTEETMYEDAALVYQMARSGFAKDSIIIYGKSLGTGIAAWLASVKDCRKLILESPYYSMDALMQHYLFAYPMHWLSKYHFPTNEYLPKVEVPVIIFHGTDDDIIPIKQSEKLKAIYPKAELIQIAGGNHNDLSNFPVFHEKLNELLKN